MRLNPIQIIGGLIAVLLSIVGSFTGLMYSEIRGINTTLASMATSIALQGASNTYQDEQLRSLRADYAALERECRRRWERAN